MNRLALLLLPVLAFTACSGLDEDEALEDQFDDGDRDDFVDGVVQGAGGVILPSEAQCWSDAVIATGATPADLDRFAADPLAPSAAEYTDLLTECIDTNLDADVPIEGDVRSAFIGGMVDAGLTGADAECVLDGLVAGGFDGRDLFLAGVAPETQTEFSAGLDAAILGCL